MNLDIDYAIAHGIIDPSHIRQKVDMEKRKELLAKHDCNIWKCKDGRWYTRFREGDRRYSVVRKSKKELEDAIVAFQRNLIENPTINEVFEEWNNRRLQLEKVKPPTFLRYAETYKRHYAEFGEHRIKDVTPRDFQEFLEDQIPLYGLNAKAFSNLRTVTRGFLKKAKRDGMISWNVDEMLMDLDVSKDDYHRKTHADCEEVFDEEETERLLSHLSANKDQKNTAILFMFFTGMRIGEVVSLTPEDLSADGKTIKVHRTESKRRNENGKMEYFVADYPKTRAGVREIVVPQMYQRLVRITAWDAKGREFLFIQDNGSRLTTEVVRKRLTRLCERMGILHKSPHKIRKTYGTMLLDCDLDKRFVMEQMGHTDIAVTEKHYHRNRK